MVLASVLGIQLVERLESDDLKEFCECVGSNAHWVFPPEPMAVLVLVVVKFSAQTPFPTASAMFHNSGLRKAHPSVYSSP